jgi:hypothetical protein
MRIENTARSSSVASRGGVSRGGIGGSFFLAEDAAVSHAAPAQASAPTASIDALLALQAVEDPLFAKRKAIRRGNALLDTLETIKADLLLGQVSEGRLNQLMALIGQARQRGMPGLDGVLDDMELAKFGRYPAL